MTALLVGMGYTEEDAVAALKATGELGKAMDWISKLSEVTAIEESHEPAASGALVQDQNETQGQESPQEKAPPPAESAPIQDEDTHVVAPVALFPAAPLESNEVQPEVPTEHQQEEDTTTTGHFESILQELAEMGFTGDDARKAVVTANGDLKTAVKIMVQKERTRHGTNLASSDW